ncbi:hypothetical protein GCM10010467_15500 [Actinocorallia glomerata]|uniref:Uncharacterized protein n=2 Tax=Actinomycetes TaxID=1760 RepID=A0ABP6LRD0_9MICC
MDRLRDIDGAARADYRRAIGTTSPGAPWTPCRWTGAPRARSPPGSTRSRPSEAPSRWLTRRRRTSPVCCLLSAALARQVDVGAIGIHPAKGLTPKITTPEKDPVYLSPEAVERWVKVTLPHLQDLPTHSVSEKVNTAWEALGKVSNSCLDDVTVGAPATVSWVTSAAFGGARAAKLWAACRSVGARAAGGSGRPS